MAYPTITSEHTSIWLTFWNETFKDYLEGELSGTSASGGWPTAFTLEGRVLEAESDGLEAAETGSPALALVLPAGSKWLIGGRLYTIDLDETVGGLSPNATNWIELDAEYDAEFDTTTYSLVEHSTRPDYGTGIIAKVTTLSDRIDTIDVTEDETDIIPTLPLILNRIRAAATTGGGGGGGGDPTVYIEELDYTTIDPRNAVLVIEEKIAAVKQDILTTIESGGAREAPTEVDQLWSLTLGLVRGLREIFPEALRYMNVSSVRPGIQGTETAGDSEVFDLGGTLPQDTEQRNYNPFSIFTWDQSTWDGPDGWGG